MNDVIDMCHPTGYFFRALPLLVLSSLCDPWIEYLHLSFEIQVRNCPARWKRKYLLRLKYCLSVSKCRGSKVVGRGRGSWVWVNVAGKNDMEKNDKVK